MLRQDVCIVLNEREAPKAKIAEILELRFKDLNITTSRLTVDKNVSAVVAERRPRFVILDYLLGDFTTGLDVLNALNAVPSEERPRVIFLTDEPSINVAVQALKQGAEDYLEIDAPQSLHAVVTLVERALAEDRAQRVAPKAPPTRLDELVATAPRMQQVLTQLRDAIIRRAPGVVLLGGTGSGRTTLARGAALSGAHPGAWSYTNIAAFLHAPHQLAGMTRDPRGGIRPREGHLVILDNLEGDEGEILTALATSISREPLNGGMIIGCTSERATAEAFARITGGEIIQLPSLDERRNDISALIQRFVREAETMSGKKIAPFDTELVLKMTDSQWPGNVRQLRTVVINTALDNTLDGAPLAEAFTTNYSLSVATETETRHPLELDPLIVAATFSMNGRHYRRTGARLGCDASVVHRILAEATTSSTEER